MKMKESVQRTVPHITTRSRLIGTESVLYTRSRCATRCFSRRYCASQKRQTSRQMSTMKREAASSPTASPVLGIRVETNERVANNVAARLSHMKGYAQGFLSCPYMGCSTVP
jgi:hypothetical protein